MRIDASALAFEGMRYASPAAAGGENEAVLGKSAGLTGYYESTPAGHVVDAKSTEIEVRRAAWRVGSGRVGADETTRLTQVALNLEIPAGDAKTQLRLGLETARLPRVRYESEGLSLSASAELQGAMIERDAKGKLSVVAVSAQLRDVTLRSGGTVIQVGQLKARRFVLVSDAETRISAEALELSDVRLSAGDANVRATKIELGRGLAWQGGKIEFADLAVSGLDATYDVPASVEEAPEPTTAAPRSAKKLPDVPALDQLDGHVSADIRIHATLPLLKERGATHALRVPIDRGVISFGDLEDGFSAVADALLDFEVEGDTLKLELDVIPIVKFDNITLVSWKLVDPVDRELAAQKSIRLRRLMRFDLPSSKEDEPAKRHDKGSIRLLGLDFEPISVQLSARAPVVIPVAGGTVRLDDGEGRALEALEVGGAIHVALEGESKEGKLRASAKGIVAELDDMDFGAVSIQSGKVSIPSIDSVHATFDGATPRRIVAVVPALRVEGARLALGTASS